MSEHCYICDADVPLDSPEVAKCIGVESETGFSKHKLQRCSVSVQVSFLHMHLQRMLRYNLRSLSINI